MSQKKVAIMQPYLFPYLGYFQLIHAVDVFVFYDDVNFISRGWINRNRVLVNERDSFLTVPLIKASQNKLIYEIEVFYDKEYDKLLKKIEIAYGKAPYFKEVYEIVKYVFSNRYDSIAEMAIDSIKNTLDYLNINKKFYISSEAFAESKGMEKANRLTYITKKLDAENYINPYGGADLYNKEYFEERGISLHFMRNRLKEYKQFNNEFVKGLSMIDVLMFNHKEIIRDMLCDFELI